MVLKKSYRLPLMFKNFKFHLKGEQKIHFEVQFLFF